MDIIEQFIKENKEKKEKEEYTEVAENQDEIDFWWEQGAMSFSDYLTANGYQIVKKKECKHGHKFNKANTIFVKWGGENIRRVCRICRALNLRKYKRIKKGATFADIEVLRKNTKTWTGKRPPLSEDHRKAIAESNRRRIWKKPLIQATRD